MKKIKSVLCGALAFVAGSVVLSACGTKTISKEHQEQPIEQTQLEPTPTTSTLGLDEAKTMILRAMAVDGIDDNRNVLEKLGNFTATFLMKMDMKDGYYGTYDNHEVVEYQGGNYVKYLINDKHRDGIYYTEYYHYQENGTDYDYSYNSETKSVDEYRYLDMLYSSIFCEMFSDKLFGAYQGTVTKTDIDGGYTLSLQLDYAQFRAIGNEINPGSFSTDEEQASLPSAVRDRQGGSMVITFDDKDQISAVTFAYVDVSVYTDNYMISDTFVEVTKRNDDFKEPDWIVAYRENQN